LLPADSAFQKSSKMLPTMTLYLAALPMLAMSVAAEKTIQYISVVSYEDQDCTGNALTAIYDSSGGADSASHCFVSADHSLQDLKALDKSCYRGTVTAYANDDCSDPNADTFLFTEDAIGDALSCKNVVEGYGSFRLGCIF
jgi:hypothetical protein